GIDITAFQWAADGKAMNVLRSITPLNAVAKTVSEKVGRRWIESTFNSVLLGENQLPEIYKQAVKAARILGMSHMPGIYLSGERAWDCLTFGTDKDSFVIIGSALAGNFQGDEMLFLLAREMGHCRVGHALWNTVARFLLGEQGQQKGIMSGGIFNAILNPTALIEGAIEVPLLAWARQSEITADRAGLLTVGDEQIARRVLLTWSLKSAFMYRQINIEEWLKQQAADDNNFSKLSEFTTSSTPYITRRLKLLNEFADSRELQRWRQLISGFIKQNEPPIKQSAPPENKPKPAEKNDKEVLKIKCATCQTLMRVPLKVLEDKKELPVKCPNAKCGKITRLKKNVKPAQKTEVSKPNKMEENLNYGD
ncbi:MAG: M48 family metallopeptidase, partial [Acidobacteriota bacterium]